MALALSLVKHAEGGSVRGADPCAGLLGDEHAGSHIPRLEVELPVRVDHA